MICLADRIQDVKVHGTVRIDVSRHCSNAGAITGHASRFRNGSKVPTAMVLMQQVAPRKGGDVDIQISVTVVVKKGGTEYIIASAQGADEAPLVCHGRRPRTMDPLIGLRKSVRRKKFDGAIPIKVSEESSRRRGTLVKGLWMSEHREDRIVVAVQLIGSLEVDQGQVLIAVTVIVDEQSTDCLRRRRPRKHTGSKSSGPLIAV